MKIFEHRPYPLGLPDLVLYSSIIDDGVLLLQDGTMIASWSFRGPDLGAATSEEMAVLSERLARILRLGSNWMIQCDAIRSYAPGYPEDGDFPDSVTRLIDTERRQQFIREGAHFESEYFLNLSFCPPSAKSEKLAGFMFEKTASTTKSRPVAMKALDDFKAKITTFEEVFKNSFQAHRLKGKRVEDESDAGFWGLLDEQLQYVRRVVTGENYPFPMPDVPAFLNDLIATRDFTPGKEPKLGNKHLRIFSIDSFPGATFPGCLSVLDSLPFEYRWHTRAKTMDASVGVSLINGHMKQWQGKIRGFFDVMFNRPSGNLNLDAMAMRDDAQHAMALVSSGEVQAVHYDSCIVLMNESLDELQKQELMIVKALSNAAYGVRRETLNAVEAWCGSLVGDAYNNVRRSLILTRNLSDLFPISSIWSGEKYNPSPLMPTNSPALLQATSVGSTTFRLNIHWKDIGHFVVLGPTGAGKSTLLATIVAQFFRYANAQVFCFDKGYSMWALNQACGGSFYDISGPSNSLSFCPLSHLDTASDRTWAVEYIETLCKLVGLEMSVAKRNAIAMAIDLLSGSPERTMTEFTNYVQDEEIRDALRTYTVRGSLGSLLDAASHEDTLKHGHFTVFEMQHLMGLGDKAVIPVLLYLFRQIRRRLDGRPSLIVLDEAWVFLDNAMFQATLREWLKEMRKLNCAVGFATQSLSDVYKSAIRDVVLEQCMTKFYLPNGEAGNEVSREYYQKFGCNRREISLIQKAIPKQQYFVTSPDGRRLFSLGLGKVALSWVAVSDPKKISVLKELKAKFPSDWVERWVHSTCGQSWAEFYRNLEENSALSSTLTNAANINEDAFYV